jgi:hypothetical protein
VIGLILKIPSADLECLVIDKWEEGSFWGKEIGLLNDEAPLLLNRCFAWPFHGRVP